MIPLKIIGIGLDPDDITLKQDKLIRTADLLIGGTEQLNVYKNLKVEKLEIKSNLTFIVETILKNMVSKSIVVLASGDPLFYGIGSYLIKKIGKDNVVIYPNISSVAKAFSKIKEPWQGANLISLHGNRAKNISKLFDSEKYFNKKYFCLLTDKTKNPAWIAQKLIEQNALHFTMCVIERLGKKEEKITWFQNPSKVEQSIFAYPNIVILKRDNPLPDSLDKSHIRIGIPDDQFSHDKGLITKSEIRSIVLSKLNFTSHDQIFWDLGAGSGSVSIEASPIIPKGSIYAVEKNMDRILLIEKNISDFKRPNIKVIHAKLPDGLDKLPNPDRIFIGGGGKDLISIIGKAINKLSINGIIVVNAVLIQNLDSVVCLMKDMGLKPESIAVQISRSKPMPYGDRFEALNPVWIIYGKKES